MPINFFKRPLNHDWTCRKAIIIHQHAIEPIPSSGSSITPKFRAGTNLWALISTCSFKLSSGPINPRQTCWSELNSGLSPLFRQSFRWFFSPSDFFSFCNVGGKCVNLSLDFPGRWSIIAPPPINGYASRTAHRTSVGTRRRVILTTEGNKTRNGSDWSQQGKKEHTVGRKGGQICEGLKNWRFCNLKNIKIWN